MLELLQEMSWYIEEQDECLKLNDLNSFGGRRLYQDIQTKVSNEIIDQLTNETEPQNTSKHGMKSPNQCPSKKLPIGQDYLQPSSKVPAMIGETLLPVQLQFIEILSSNDPRHPDNKKQSTVNNININHPLPTRIREKSTADENSHSSIKINPHYSRQRIERSKGPFKCNICGEYFDERNALTAHQLRHTSNRPLKCDNCPARFFTEYELGQHGKVHRRNERFKCSYCNASYSVKKFLLKHEILHTTSYFHPQTMDTATHKTKKTSNRH